MSRPPRKIPKAPTAAYLQEAALAHLARYAATRAGLLRVLDRKIARWATAAEAGTEAAQQARADARAVVAKLTETGAVSDTAFAEARTRSLQRAGKSARAIGAHLSAKGVPAAIKAERAAPNPDQELAAACIHARKRRLGPFRTAEESPELRRRELAAMARAGFSQPVARQALRLAREEADALVISFRAEL
jgi:regulatory protein